MTCDRRAVEAELRRDERAVLRRWGGMLGLSEDGWHHVPGLAVVAEAVAIERRYGQALRRGMSKRGALEFACARFGVAVGTYARRRSRWLEEAW